MQNVGIELLHLINDKYALLLGIHLRLFQFLKVWEWPEVLVGACGRKQLRNVNHAKRLNFQEII